MQLLVFGSSTMEPRGATKAKHRDGTRSPTGGWLESTQMDDTFGTKLPFEEDIFCGLALLLGLGVSGLML
jgi:hypothetical protein